MHQDRKCAGNISGPMIFWLVREAGAQGRIIRAKQFIKIDFEQARRLVWPFRHTGDAQRLAAMALNGDVHRTLNWPLQN